MRKRWTKTEEAFLVRHYAFLSNTELAGRLGRTVESIEKKAGELGLAKEPGRLGPEGQAVLRAAELAGTWDFEEVCEMLEAVDRKLARRLTTLELRGMLEALRRAGLLSVPAGTR